MRAAPFEDLGFARVDTHRQLRQGFPEVILGVGKTPTQIARDCREDCRARTDAARHRATPEAYEAVRALVPGVSYHPDARAITFAQRDVEAGRARSHDHFRRHLRRPDRRGSGRDRRASWATAIDRLYDVGVAGLHRLLAETHPPSGCPRRGRRRRDGGRTAECQWQA
jgi:NCAIR mutase (PurE)-related protein